MNQKVWYQTANCHIPQNSPQNSNPTLSFESPPPVKPNPDKNRTKLHNHNIKIDYTEETLKKSKDDTVIISCVEEMKLTGKFYTLSRQALMRAYKNEDFLLRVSAEIKADIDIIETYFIKDYNIIEKKFSGQKSCVGNDYKTGDTIEELRLLCPISSTGEWITQEKYNNLKTNLIFRNHYQSKLNHSDKLIGPALTPTATGQIDNNQLPEDSLYNKNLAPKLLSNSTIIGSSTSLSNQMFSLSISAPNEDGLKTDDIMSTSGNSLTMSSSMSGLNQMADNKQLGVSNFKCIYNRAIDAVNLIEENRGFFKKLPSEGIFTSFGVFCVRWRRSGSTVENESKFTISGVEVIEPPLNVYCYFDCKMYVRTPMTFKICLKNPSSRILHLIATLNNSDSFMFAGHKQVRNNNLKITK